MSGKLCQFLSALTKFQAKLTPHNMIQSNYMLKSIVEKTINSVPLPHSMKFCWENFGEFGERNVICENFARQTLSYCKFTKVFLAKTIDKPKFYPAHSHTSIHDITKFTQNPGKGIYMPIQKLLTSWITPVHVCSHA